MPPAQLALATLLQASTGVSDDEVIEAPVMDRRWHLVLDCLDCARPPVSKATPVRFRQRLITHELDRRLVERTVALAERDGGFGPRAIRAARDASPLWGAGRVEATCNLVGHALRKALGVLARQQGRELTAVATEAGAGVVAQSSLKAALDRDGDDPTARDGALGVVVTALAAVAAWVAEHAAGLPPVVAESLAAARPVDAQDVVAQEAGATRLRQGVAADRRLSREDPDMRHGRKRRSQLVDGYKRHVVRDLDSGVVHAAGITLANVPEAEVTDAIRAALTAQQATVGELHLDRADLSSTWVRERPPGMALYGQAWPVRSGPYYPKTAFGWDWEQGTRRCPNDVVVPFIPGGTVQFPRAACAGCALRARWTSSATGRTVTIHPDERLLVELRTRHQTAVGRAKLRERVAVEHSLAQVGQWYGWRARYRGRRTNLSDLRRVVVVHNPHRWARRGAGTDAAAA